MFRLIKVVFYSAPEYHLINWPYSPINPHFFYNMEYLDLDSELEKLGKYKDFPRYLCEGLDSTKDGEEEIPWLDRSDKIQRRAYFRNRKEIIRRIPDKKLRQELTGTARKTIKKTRLYTRYQDGQIQIRHEFPKGTPGRPQEEPHWWRVVWLLQAFFKKFRGRPHWNLIAAILNRYQKAGERWDYYVIQKKWQRKLKNKKFRDFVKAMNAEAFLDDELRGYESILNQEGYGEKF